MFKCDICGKNTRPGEPIKRIVTKKRDKEYKNRKDVVTYGWEIVEEIQVCPRCALKYEIEG